MAHITGGDVAGGLTSSVFVTIKLTIFAEATYHFALVSFDALVAGIVGLIVVHYGKKILPIWDNFMFNLFKKK